LTTSSVAVELESPTLSEPTPAVKATFAVVEAASSAATPGVNQPTLAPPGRRRARRPDAP
jgi:hypothetical protein